VNTISQEFDSKTWDDVILLNCFGNRESEESIVGSGSEDTRVRVASNRLPDDLADGTNAVYVFNTLSRHDVGDILHGGLDGKRSQKTSHAGPSATSSVLGNMGPQDLMFNLSALSLIGAIFGVHAVVPVRKAGDRISSAVV